ncbi:MAG: hypothetical protein HFF51_03980 [Lawsonibacter sp.]|jgi:hypothetical protein|nr:hypothetical protein [Lawsonibacter sp.]
MIKGILKVLKGLCITVVCFLTVLFLIGIFVAIFETDKPKQDESSQNGQSSGDVSISEPDISDKKSNGDYEIILQNELPVTLSFADYRGNIESSWSVTDFRYEVSNYDFLEEQTATFYLSGEKIYDVRGSGQGGPCWISWQLFDTDGYVVDSGTCYSPSVREGEKFKDAESRSSKLAPGTYYLELHSTN